MQDIWASCNHNQYYGSKYICFELFSIVTSVTNSICLLPVLAMPINLAHYRPRAFCSCNRCKTRMGYVSYRFFCLVGDVSVELSLQVTNSEHYFSWSQFGLSLHIPEDSLPEGIQQCSIFIKPRTMGDYKLPENSHLVSAVYSVKCVPKCKFLQPITLEIQHCAKPKNTHKLSFARAVQSSSEQKVSFYVVEAGESSQIDGILCSYFPHHTSYGFVELSKFCQFGVIQRDTDERDYCVNVYHREDNARKHRVYFTILWNINTCKKVSAVIIVVWCYYFLLVGT